MRRRFACEGEDVIRDHWIVDHMHPVRGHSERRHRIFCDPSGDGEEGAVFRVATGGVALLFWGLSGWPLLLSTLWGRTP
jgi:hypothetical protein